MTAPIDALDPDDAPVGSDEQMLTKLLRETFDYFVFEENKHTGLMPDHNAPGTPASIAVVGMALSAYVVAVERGIMTRATAIERTLRVLRFFAASEQSESATATGYKGFYYHFIDVRHGKRAWSSELSTIDTGFLIAGMLVAADFFTASGHDETEIRALADMLYRRVDWTWALNGGTTLSHGWKPDTGFLPYRWDDGYNEAMLLYVLALGSPTFPIPVEGYLQWTSTFEWRSVYGFDYFYAGPLFIHQFSHQWLDFRGIRDDASRQRGLDYFENSRRATAVHREYAIQNPNGFAQYSAFGWGLTASDGPGPARLKVDGRQRQFLGYAARGAPDGPDDGTISPWAVVASLPFAPSDVLATVRHAIERLKLKHRRLYGFDASFNPTFPDTQRHALGWISPWRFGINQGPIVMMIGNYQSAVIWNVTKRCRYLRAGLRRAGFRGGWLDVEAP